MPELPEVEVTRRGIAAPLLGARVLAARLGKPLRWPLGRPAEGLVGAVVGEVARRGKYLWLPLQQAPAVHEGDQTTAPKRRGSLSRSVPRSVTRSK